MQRTKKGRILMLLCKEQEKTFVFDKIEVAVSDKYLNAYFVFHDMPLNKLAVSVFFSTHKDNMSKQDVLDNYNIAQLSKIVESGIKSEISGLMQNDFEQFWASIPE